MMKPERIALGDLLHPAGADRLKDLAAQISKGAVFIYPTETIYGIGGAYNTPGVAKKIFALKGRVSTHPLIVIGSDRSSFGMLHLVWPQTAIRLAERFWPGPLTLVLPLRSGGDLAVRASPYPLISALCSCCSTPLYSTSANHSGESYNPDPETIFRLFRNRVNFIIDAGFLPPSSPSTIVKITADGEFTLVREGAVSNSDISRALGRLSDD
jgi:L-threonylcarbamoyladenylate synthase